MSKIALLILTLGLSLWAKQELKLKTDLDLYRYPNKCSLKIKRYFHKGERLVVYGCDRYGWCRVDHGYVKGYKIGLASASKRAQEQKDTAPQIAVEKIDLSLYETKTAADLNHSNVSSTKPSLNHSDVPSTKPSLNHSDVPSTKSSLNHSDVPSTEPSAPKIPYAHYFEPKSARLNVHVTP